MMSILDQELVKKFPLLYRDRSGPATHTLMGFGFDCGDGWADILFALSRKLETEIRRLEKKNPDIQYKASQVKEKYGTLSFYMNYSTPIMNRWIGEAEKLSARTCETCGHRGKLVNINMWYSTLCTPCRKKQEDYANHRLFD